VGGLGAALGVLVVSDAEASEARPADEPGEAAGAAGRRARRVRLAPLEWVALIVGLVLVIQYAWFMDDAFVYFRYVDNLLFLPYGLVYNAGEYVEGFSSPAWTLLLIALRSTGADWWLLTRLVGAISFVVFVLAARRVNAELGPADGPRFNLPLAFLAANYGVLCYFTSGLEGPLVHLAAAA
jgi:hypothetical protein